MNPLRPLPAYADTACSPGQGADPCPHIPLSSNERHAASAGPPHTIHLNHARCHGAVLPARPAGARFPMPRAGSFNEVRDTYPALLFAHTSSLKFLSSPVEQEVACSKETRALFVRRGQSKKVAHPLALVRTMVVRCHGTSPSWFHNASADMKKSH